MRTRLYTSAGDLSIEEYYKAPSIVYAIVYMDNCESKDGARTQLNKQPYKPMG